MRDRGIRVYHVYVLASRSRRLYVGVTRDLRRRVAQHQSGCMPGYTRRYGITILVHAEPFSDIHAAIEREKQLKRWPRWRKDRLIGVTNPTWADLAAAAGGDECHPAGVPPRAARGHECRDRPPRREAGIQVGTPIPTLAPAPPALLRDDTRAPGAALLRDDTRAPGAALLRDDTRAPGAALLRDDTRACGLTVHCVCGMVVHCARGAPNG